MDDLHTAEAVDAGILAAFDEGFPAEFPAAHSVGALCESYQLKAGPWTLISDTATPNATLLPDLLQKHGSNTPETWSDGLAVSDRTAHQRCLHTPMPACLPESNFIVASPC